MPKIKLQQWPSPLNAKSGSILDAALAAGVPYPHSCRSGECGDCKSQLYAGKVIMDGYDPEVLTKAERDAGLILACRARPRGDIEVAWLQEGGVQAIHPVRRLETTVVHMGAATHDITRVRLKVHSDPLTFAAGQYAELKFNGCPARPYSMANRPDEETLEFHIRHVSGGVVSSHVARETCVGDTVQVEGPYGTAFLRESAVEPTLLIAGGAGLAPMKSILLAALAQDAKRPIHLYHGVREARDLYDGKAIASASAAREFNYIPVLSSPSQATDYRTGFVHEAVAGDFGTLSGFRVYVAGPPPMVDATTAAVVRLGVRREDVHADAFYNSARDDQPQQPNDQPQQPGDQPQKKSLFRAFGLFRSRKAA